MFQMFFFIFSLANLPHKECYLLLFKRSCYINWWVKVGVWHWFDWGFFFNCLEVYCDCTVGDSNTLLVYLQFPQLENTLLLWASKLLQALHTHTCLIVQVADGAVLVGCNGNWLDGMADHAVNQLAAYRGRERKTKYCIIVQQPSSRDDIAFIKRFTFVMWCEELLFSAYVKNGIILSDILLKNAIYIYIYKNWKKKM